MKQRENSAAGMVVGMAAGAALGAAGAMMATQSKRQMRRNVRKVMKGAENAVMQLDKMATDFEKAHRLLNSKKRRPGWNGAFYRASYFAQMHIRAVVLISPSRLRSIWMLQVTVSDLFTSLPVSTEAGRFLMVRMPLPFSISPVRVPV